MPATHLTTLRDLLRYAVSRFQSAKIFFGHGTQNAYDEAVYLILHTLNLPLDKLDPFLEARLLPDEIQMLLNIIERRITERIPSAYLTHEAWLMGYRFYVDERVIVPRSFIAELIPEQLSPWIAHPESVTHILELCTGSGCLSIMLADAFPNAHIDAVDISEEALAVAKRNIADYELQGRITLIQSDLYQQLPPQKYNLIIANPPYVNSQSMRQLPPEYQREPKIALDGGTYGMDLVRPILSGAKQRLHKNGALIVEIGHERPFAEATFPEHEFTWLSTSAGDDMIFLLTQDTL